MSQDAMTSAVLYGGAMALVGAVSGRGLDLANNAVSGALMGVASLADDMTHKALDREGTIASSMIAMGVWFAGLQAVVRGDMDYGRNALAGGATSLVVELYY